MRKLSIVLFICFVSGVFAQQNTAPDDFIRINYGMFTMGSPANEVGRDDDEVQHQVTVSSFYMGKYAVTQKEWTAIMGSNPSYSKGDNLPVEQVSWYDAIVFCNKLSILKGLTPAYNIGGNTDPNEWGTIPTERNATWDAITIVANSNGYRLPTEAQWEYVCRAGTNTRYWSGDNETTLIGKANIADLTLKDRLGGDLLEEWINIRDGYASASPVGSFQANPWGLFDMHGNVWEWCWDWYGSYPSGAQTDPTGASSGSNRVVRGGNWWGSAAYIRSANRSQSNPSNRRDMIIGVRLSRP